MNLEPEAATQDLMRQLRSGSLFSSALRTAPSRRDAVAPVTPVTPLSVASSAEPPAAVLPLPMTRFYGREKEIEQLLSLLSPERDNNTPPPLVTLTGQGGAGKTRLALEVARRLATVYAQAVWFVPLADVLSPERILDALCETLDLSRSAQSDPAQQATEFLSGYPAALLIIDNFEHLQEEGTGVLQALRRRLPHLACLVTSRHKLNIEGERDLTLSPLAIPEGAQSWEGLQIYPSVQLFLDRAQAARYSFALTPANADAVTALVQQSRRSRRIFNRLKALDAKHKEPEHNEPSSEILSVALYTAGSIRRNRPRRAKQPYRQDRRSAHGRCDNSPAINRGASTRSQPGRCIALQRFGGVSERSWCLGRAPVRTGGRSGSYRRGSCVLPSPVDTHNPNSPER
ncbi:MAG: DNA-binding transcriptional activator of the family [Chthonomonadaceae bacterium]|nr:DNA-binding transcriptional activator of the family [Chthonomonadaceae bacterium]